LVVVNQSLPSGVRAPPGCDEVSDAVAVFIPSETVVTNGTVRPFATEVRIPPGAKEIEFHYTALSLAVPERVRFKYRLEGYDEDWVDAGSRRVAYYSNLRPGRYRFRVVASNDDGVWNNQGAFANILLEPRFYQSSAGWSKRRQRSCGRARGNWSNSPTTMR
jgi:hypothetical protein